MNPESHMTKNRLRACLTVVVVLAIGVAAWMYFRVERPVSAADVLLFLLLLTCPVMMILMMRGGGDSKKNSDNK